MSTGTQAPVHLSVCIYVCMCAGMYTGSRACLYMFVAVYMNILDFSYF